MGAFTRYQCSVCGTNYGPDEVTYTCPADGGNLNVTLDYEAIKREWSPAQIAASNNRSIWRYAPILPVGKPTAGTGPLLTVGGTPFHHAPRLAQSLGLRHVYVKDDGQLPTASFKDRASSVVVQRAVEQGIDKIITASTGNAGVALAGMAAAAGVEAVILVPETAPPAKIAQLLIFGARLFLVKGNYDAAFDLTLQASQEFGWYCRNTGYNPFTAEGKKTAAFEIAEQFTNYQVPVASDQWLVPDRIFVSVGDGNIISGIHKGFKDLYALGWIDRVPKLMGVQAEGSAAIANAFRTGTEDIVPVAADTVADSIAADLPRDGLRALRAATETGGAYVTVSDEEILAAMVPLARKVAVFAEPAAAAAHAGLVKCVQAGIVGTDEQIVVMVTDNGLKDVGAAMKATGEAPRIESTLDSLQAALNV
ncbi:MAG: threonine synthase [Anaerolineales bacterium]